MMSLMNFSQLNFGLFALKIYGLCASFAFALASWWYYKKLQAEGFSTDFFLHHYWRWLLGGLLLGRLMAVLMDPTIFDRFGLMAFFAFWDGEIAFYGAGIGFLLTMYLDLKKAGHLIGPWLDLGMQPFLLAVMILNWGAFFTGKVYGIETSLPWGIKYETFGVEILNPVHPITLYAFMVHLILWWWIKEHQFKWQKVPGVLSLKTLLYFLIIDFCLQFLRGNTLFEWGGMTINQYLAIVGIFVLTYWLYGNKNFSKAIRGNWPKRKKKL